MYSRICQKDWIKRFAYYQLAAFIVAVVETLIIYVLLSIFSLGFEQHEKEAAVMGIPLLLIGAGQVVALILLTINYLLKVYLFPPIEV